MKKSLFKKLQIKKEYSVLLMNSNPEIHPLFEGIRIEFREKKEEHYDSVILFAKSEDEISRLLPDAKKKAEQEGQIWLSYPKKTGSLKGTLTRESTWKAIEPFGLQPVRMISLNDDWASMQLVEGRKRKQASSLGQDPPGVDRATKTVTLPEDLNNALKSNANASAFFNTLSFSQKRAYLTWIHSAKRSTTREKRIIRTVELLAENKKIP